MTHDQMTRPVPGKHFRGPVGDTHIDRRAQCGFATILVVDDETVVRIVAEMLLQRCGYRTLQAGSGAEAISICDAEIVDLVLSDVGMPGMDGFTLARELQMRHPGVPVLFMSGYIPDEFSPTQSQSTILLKPFIADGLGQAVARSLAASQGCGEEFHAARAAGFSTAFSPGQIAR